MEDIIITQTKKPKLKNPVLVEGLPGIGLVGKIAADHMADELNAEKFAEIHSMHLPPQVNIQEDGTVKLVNMEFHYYNKGKKDIIFLLGDFQGMSPESQYLLTERTLDFTQELGVKRIITLGGLGTGSITHEPKVFGAATNKKLVAELKKKGIIFKGGGAIFGASGLLLGLSMPRGMEAACLMGETHGQIIDAKSGEAVLKSLADILGVNVDMTKIAKKAKETEEQISQVSSIITDYKKAEAKQQEMMEENPFYIR